MTLRVQRYLPNLTTIGLALMVALLTVNVLVSEWNIKRLVENDRTASFAQPSAAAAF